MIQKEIEEDSIIFNIWSCSGRHEKPVYEIPGLADAPESLYFKTIYNLTSIYPNLQPTHEMLHRAEAFWVVDSGGK